MHSCTPKMPSKLLTKRVCESIEKDPDGFVRELFEGYKTKSMALKKLQAIIQEANEAYRNSGHALLSDGAYDALEEEYETRASGDKAVKAVKAVGAPIPANDARKTRLPFWMGSMDKIKDTDDTALNKWIKKYPGNYVVTDKLDGNSAMLHYKDGKVALYTRGDGVIGQDISHLIPLLMTELPDAMPKKTHMAIRGELIMSKESFKSIERVSANARNAVAGLINSKDINKKVALLTEFVAYELVEPTGLSIEDQLLQLQELDVPTVYAKRVKTLSVDKLSKCLATRKDESEYEVDGIVVQHNQPHERVDGQNPSYAFAFKSMAALPTARVTVTSVEWALSKHGLLKPVVHFPGVKLSGVTITRATGHNAEFVHDNEIGPGATIEIVRSGDVIPYISAVIKGAKSGPQMPDEPYEWNATGKEVLLKMDEAGSAALHELGAKQIENFLSKLGAKGVASGSAKILYENGFDTIKKVVGVRVEDLVGLPGIKAAKARVIVTGIQNAVRDAYCVTLMEASNAFGIGFGTRKLQAILNGLGEEKLSRLMSGKFRPTVKELLDIDGVGKTSADNFLAGMERFVDFVKDTKLKCAATPPEAKEAAQEAVDNPRLAKYVRDTFGGKTVVFTGVRHAGLEALIKAAGGKVTTSVSKNTDVLVANEQRGKYETAVKINEEAGREKIKILDWSEVSRFL